jgi:hypothetical protein
MAMGTAIQDSPIETIFCIRSIFSVARQSVPLEAKDKMRVAEDEG